MRYSTVSETGKQSKMKPTNVFAIHGHKHSKRSYEVANAVLAMGHVTKNRVSRFPIF